MIFENRGIALDKGAEKSIRVNVLAKFNGGRRQVPSLRMAPMIDIIFLLLLFFLVTAKWRPDESFLPLKLPIVGAQTEEFGKPEPLVIYITATNTGCAVRIGGGNPVDIRDTAVEADFVVFMEELSRCIIEQRRFATDPIEIYCAANVKWEHLAKIYNLFYGAGLTDITFAMTEAVNE